MCFIKKELFKTKLLLYKTDRHKTKILKVKAESYYVL